MAWDGYRGWVRDRLPQFESTQSTENTASFARWHGGDSWILTLSGTQAGARLRVSANLVIYPD